MVQEAMRLVLQAYYEPQFRNSSHGFRTGKGCHSALWSIKRWTGTKWFIEGDIKGCFDNINHEKLLEILEKSFKDERFIKLVRQMLEAGYLEERKFTPTYSGTPQGGIVSPILANIYLNELDTFIEDKLIPQFTKGEKRRENPAYKKLASTLHHPKGKVKTGKTTKGEIIELHKKLRKTPGGNPNDPDFRRLKYIRYADDFLLGFVGPKEEAHRIKANLQEYLDKFLKLELSEEKTLITHATSEKARFLGYELNATRSASKQTKNKRGHKLRTVNGQIRLGMPRNVMTEKSRTYKTHRAELLNNSDYDIVALHQSELRGIYEYYKLATNVSALNKLQYTMLKSLVKTLAAKHKTNAVTIYRRYTDANKEIRITVEREDKKPLTIAFGKMSLIHKSQPSYETPDYVVTLYASRTELLQRLQADLCEICNGKGEVEVHHIRALKDLKQQGQKETELWKQLMIAKQRKTLVVCRQCHNDIHAGRYDGKRLTDLANQSLQQ